MNQPLNTDPAEGSREVIDRELKRQERKQNHVDHLPGVEVSGQPQGGAVDRAARHARIQERAQDLWQQKGRPDGMDEKIWLQAEQETANIEVD